MDMLKEVPTHVDEKFVKLNFLDVKGSLNGMIIGDPTMEKESEIWDITWHRLW